MSNSFTVCSASDVPPSITAEPVVPTTGDSTTPILWLTAAVLAMTGTVLLMRRRA